MASIYRDRTLLLVAFILLTCLIHLGIGTYVRLRAEPVPRILQWTGSLLWTPFSHRAACVVVAGTLLHVVAGFTWSRVAPGGTAER